MPQFDLSTFIPSITFLALFFIILLFIITSIAITKSAYSTKLRNQLFYINITGQRDLAENLAVNKIISTKNLSTVQNQFVTLFCRNI
jgi:membrane-bound metal-dependent hydrolase YbcI (DUF457 family)